MAAWNGGLEWLSSHAILEMYSTALAALQAAAARAAVLLELVPWALGALALESSLPLLPTMAVVSATICASGGLQHSLPLPCCPLAPAMPFHAEGWQ